MKKKKKKKMTCLAAEGFHKLSVASDINVICRFPSSVSNDYKR